MELDKILHDKKNFFELLDADVEAFLRDRSFNTEHLEQAGDEFVLDGSARTSVNGLTAAEAEGQLNLEPGAALKPTADTPA